MKKIIILSLMTIQALFCFSETVVSEYYAVGTKYNVEADYDNRNVLKVYIEIYAGDEHVMYLGLDNEQEVENFRTNILLIVEKFKEWSNTAKTNNVCDFVKDFPIAFKSIDIVWKSYENGDFYFSFDQMIQSTFMISEKCEHTIAIHKYGATSSSNKYIECDAFSLFTLGDFKGLYDALDLDKIKDKLNSKTNVDDLFN